MLRLRLYRFPSPSHIGNACHPTSQTCSIPSRSCSLRIFFARASSGKAPLLPFDFVFLLGLLLEVEAEASRFWPLLYPLEKLPA
jgi:hypothetical protein